MTVLLTTLVPLVTAVNLVVRLFVDDVATDGVGPAVVAALWVGFMVAVNVVFWVTVVFALAERGRVTTASSSDVGPRPAARRRRHRPVGLGETVASVGFLAAAGLAIVWQQTSSPVTAAASPVPVLDPALWSGVLPWLLLVLAGQAVVAVLALPPRPLVARSRRREHRARPRLRRAGAPAAVGAGNLFNPAFVDVLVEGGWADAERDLNLSTAIGVVVVLVWSVVETLRTPAPHRRAR